MNTTTPAYISDCGNVCEKLWLAIHGLINTANELKDAIIHRDRERVWASLSQKHERSTTLEQASALWNELGFPQRAEKDAKIQKARLEIVGQIKKLRLLDRVNKSLVSSYLSAIEKSFFKAGAGLAGKKKVYGKRGKLGMKKSMLLNMKG